MLAHRRAPLILLLVVCAIGVGARSFNLGIPPKGPGGAGTIFDEAYYVSAARLIAGVPMSPGERYFRAAPAGTDPNAEHPQLAKMVIAAAIEVGGDNATAWRATAVAFALAALLLLYWLVRCAGGGPWLALGTTALASFENLWLVSGRIAVLDIYCVPFMLAGVGFYLRRRPIIAGLLVAVGACFKEVAMLAVAVVLALEALRALRWLASGRATQPSLRRMARPLITVLVSVVAFASLLAILDAAVTPYSGGHPVNSGQGALCDDLLLWKGSCNHIAFMLNYASKLRSTGGPRGIASYPWQFWADVKQIPYFMERVTVSVNGHVERTSTTVYFRGLISRVLLFTSWAAILASIWWAFRRREEISFLVIAWVVGTWLPVEALSLFESRTSYLYYMVITMPALYIAVARLLAWPRIPRVAVAVWVALFLAEFVTLYPFRTLSGH
ncbi:MAG: phospholipid carrier-dependent glycosyltransferase [Solirubrobacterales bacterium]|nr:phospholipid carrier-dependent glycosyltransferase [Solirubrobacterales bacterium]